MIWLGSRKNEKNFGALEEHREEKRIKGCII
jgi:hypothetical protein